jgi:hypothetical protein
MAERHCAAIGSDRVATAWLDDTSHHVVPTFPFAAKPERFELPNDFKRKRVVKLAHVNIGRAQTSDGKGFLGGSATDMTGDEISSPDATEIPRWRMLIGGPVMVCPDGR